MKNKTLLISGCGEIPVDVMHLEYGFVEVSTNYSLHLPIIEFLEGHVFASILMCRSYSNRSFITTFLATTYIRHYFREMFVTSSKFTYSARHFERGSGVLFTGGSFHLLEQ
ncbi:MAG: hypothetical protein P9X24_04855 [Candidatus Hatepunaea meridiana]|nr:hypothetical protein [Candidatus Hatepunaea meridiana]